MNENGLNESCRVTVVLVIARKLPVVNIIAEYGCGNCVKS